MWKTIMVAAALLGSFAALGVLGVVIVHVLARWYLMIFGGLDWDDAGLLIRTKVRRRHGAHRLERPVVYPACEDHAGLAIRVKGDPAWMPVPPVMTTGGPPWEDATHHIPVITGGETQTWPQP